MKAAVYKKPLTIEIEDREIPKCGGNDIIVKVHACGICGSDVRNYKNGLRADVGEQVMGHEFTGTVTEVGSKVTKYRPGDRIAAAPDVSCGECYYCKQGLVNLCNNHRMIGTHWPGGFAEYVHLPEVVLERGMIHHIPEGVSLNDAALSEPASSVIACQEDVNVSLGDTVVIFGTGPIGCLHTEIARARGAAKIILVGRRRLAMAEPFGADHLISVLDSDPVVEILKITAGFGADVAICANPAAETQNMAVESVRKRGKVVLFGGLPKTDPMTTLNSNTIHYKEISVTGSFSYKAEIHKKALLAIKRGQIHPEKYFTHTLPLERITEGFQIAQDGKSLKVLIKMEGA